MKSIRMAGFVSYVMTQSEIPWLSLIIARNVYSSYVRSVIGIFSQESLSLEFIDMRLILSRGIRNGFVMCAMNRIIWGDHGIAIYVTLMCVLNAIGNNLIIYLSDSQGFIINKFHIMQTKVYHHFIFILCICLLHI